MSFGAEAGRCATASANAHVAHFALALRRRTRSVTSQDPAITAAPVRE